MSHLSARPGFRLAIQMKPHAAPSQRLLPAWLSGGPEVAQKIDHCHRREQPWPRQGKPAQSSELRLELIGGAGIHSVVAAVMGPRRHLIDQQPTTRGNEELYPEH